MGTNSKPSMVQAILPVAGVPDELIRVLNDRFRTLHQVATTPAPPTVVKGSPGPPGGTGPPGTPGTGAGTPAPGVLPTSTASVFYGGLTFGFQGQIDLPTTDPDFAAHFKRVDVVGIDPTGASHLVASFTGSAITGTSITYHSVVGPQPLDNEIWSVEFPSYNELGSPTAGPPPITGLAVYAAGITAVSAAEVPGSHFQDRLQGLHVAIDVTVTTAHLQSPLTVTLWLDIDDGNGWVWQGPFSIVGGTGTVRIGSMKPGPNMDGDVWVPPPSRTHWKIAAFPGNNANTTTLPSGAITNTFDMTPVGACSPNDITGAQFIQNPVTNDIITYILHDPGVYNWGYYQLQYTQPTIATDPWYWFSFMSIQKGHTTTGTCTVINGTSVQSTGGATFAAADVGKLIYVAGVGERKIATYVDATHITLSAAVANGAGQSFEVWNPSPITPTDDEGIDQHPDLYHGRWHAVSASFQGGVTSTPGSSVTYVGAKPPDWTFPLLKNPDGTTNINRAFRCWIYCGSHLNDLLPDGTWPPVPFVLQATCWPGAQDHFDLDPAAQPPALDLTTSNPGTWGAGLGGGGGAAPFVKPDPSAPLYADITGLHFRAGPDYVVKETSTGSGQYQLTQAIIDLALAVNFDTTNFKKSAGTFLVNQIAVNSLIAGDALFAGQATFAYKNGTTEGGIVTISSGGIGLGSTITNPLSTVAVNANGLSMIREIYSGATHTGRNRLDVTATGVTIMTLGSDLVNPTSEVSLTSTLLTIQNGSNSVQISPNGITIADNFGGTITMDSTNGIRVSHGTSSVTVAASGVTIVNGSLSSPVITGGSLTITTGQGTVAISSSTSGVEVTLGTTNKASVHASVITVYDLSANIGSEMAPYSLIVGRFGSFPCGFDASSINGGLTVGGRVVCKNDSNAWLGGLQSAGSQVFAGVFGIYGTAIGWPQTATNSTGPGGSGPGLAVGQYSTFTAQDGRTVYVQGGLIVNVK